MGQKSIFCTVPSNNNTLSFSNIKIYVILLFHQPASFHNTNHECVFRVLSVVLVITAVGYTVTSLVIFQNRHPGNTKHILTIHSHNSIHRQCPIFSNKTDWNRQSCQGHWSDDAQHRTYYSPDVNLRMCGSLLQTQWKPESDTACHQQPLQLPQS